ncbi:MAG: DDE-type integrase/transposase/recombinase [Butyrivibrio sp.]|nr:DDE-type integrase/transposase/recombinase [Butyrivibrio sp.]
MIITHTRRYLPHEFKTRLYAVKLYRSGSDVSFVCRRYHISKSSLMRWNKRYDGTDDSLRDRSHRPHSPHRTAHTEDELNLIRCYFRRNPEISLCELYGKLLSRGYSRNYGSLYRVCVRLGFLKRPPSSKERHKPQVYHTPDKPGIKWQLDVKYVPTACCSGSVPQRYYQYTVIDEATRERFIYPYMEQSGYSTCDFVRRAIVHFGYKPRIIQTDNGAEFTNIARTKRIHAFDVLCSRLGIAHKLIRPRTPRHNGKVERSHRNDQERFYNHMHFYSYDDLKLQMQRYLRRSNNIPMQVLGWLSPIQKRRELLGGET